MKLNEFTEDEINDARTKFDDDRQEITKFVHHEKQSYPLTEIIENEVEYFNRKLKGK